MKPRNEIPKIKIENIPAGRSKRMESRVGVLVDALKTIEVGQSFLLGDVSSNYRLTITVAERCLGVRFITEKTADGIRIGRVS